MCLSRNFERGDANQPHAPGMKMQEGTFSTNSANRRFPPQFVNGQRHGLPKRRFCDPDLCLMACNPEGLERHLDAVRQQLPRDRFAAQLPRHYPHRTGNLERRKKALSCGGEAIWEAF